MWIHIYMYMGKKMNYRRVIIKIDEALLIRGINPKDGTSGQGSVNICRAINGIKHNHVISRVCFFHCNWYVFFLWSYNPCSSSRSQAVAEQLKIFPSQNIFRSLFLFPCLFFIITFFYYYIRECLGQLVHTSTNFTGQSTDRTIFG